MRLKAVDCIAKLVENYKACLENDADFIVSEINKNSEANIFEYDVEVDEIVLNGDVSNVPHIRVEYGETNQFKYVPAALCMCLFNNFAKAFGAYTGIPESRIISYEFNKYYYFDGREWPK